MQSKSEYISICIPTYNGARYLKETLDSVLDQSYIYNEILIVDDCSSDNTLEIAQEYAKYDDRISVHLNSKNLGLVGNWNRCIELAQYDWIKFAFQDDILLTDCVQNLYAACKVHSTKMSLCNRRYVTDSDADPAIKGYILNDLVKLSKYYDADAFIDAETCAKLAGDHVLMNIFGEPTSLLFHKSLISKYGTFNEDIAQMVDYEYVLRVACNEGMAWVQKPGVFFRIHGGNQSNINKGDGRSEAKRLKIEYIDAALMLHDFVHLEHYSGLRNHEEANRIHHEKYKAEILKGVDQIGIDKLTDLAKVYADDYPMLTADIKTYGEEFLASRKA